MEQGTQILEELLRGYKIPQFDPHRLKEATEDSVREVYTFLREHKFSTERIVAHSGLLVMKPDVVKERHRLLHKKKISDEKIVVNAKLMASSSRVLDKNYQHHVGLLRDDDAIGLDNYKFLCYFKHYDKNIEDQELKDLLGDFRDSGARLLAEHPSLLNITPETMLANVQYMSKLNIIYADNNDGFLLDARPQKKRAIMAWMLRELFDYREAKDDKDRKATIGRLYSFVSKNPRVLSRSIAHLEENKEFLIAKTKSY